MAWSKARLQCGLEGAKRFIARYGEDEVEQA